jgi:hypothetical protein
MSEENEFLMEVSHDKDNNEILLDVIPVDDPDNSIPFRIHRLDMDDFTDFIYDIKIKIEDQHKCEGLEVKP